MIIIQNDTIFPTAEISRNNASIVGNGGPACHLRKGAANTQPTCIHSPRRRISHCIQSLKHYSLLRLSCVL
jgi:hypothetical protein